LNLDFIDTLPGLGLVPPKQPDTSKPADEACVGERSDSPPGRKSTP